MTEQELRVRLEKLGDAADVAYEAYCLGVARGLARGKADGISEGLKMAADWRASKVAPQTTKEPVL